jgi:polyisoprenoid-binding protein YceI
MSTIEATKQALPVGTWQIDPVHSQLTFAVEYMVGTFRGSFSPVEASLAVDEAGEAVLSGRANVADIKLQDENLVAHLLTPDFFDAERTPAIAFTSTEISRSGEEVVIDGDLEIKGVSRPVELTGTISDPIEDAYGRERIGLKLQTTIDRTAFGLNWNLPLPNGKPALANDVELGAELYLVKA